MNGDVDNNSVDIPSGSDESDWDDSPVTPTKSSSPPARSKSTDLTGTENKPGKGLSLKSANKIYKKPTVVDQDFSKLDIKSSIVPSTGTSGDVDFFADMMPEIGKSKQSSSLLQNSSSTGKLAA